MIFNSFKWLANANCKQALKAAFMRCVGCHLECYWASTQASKIMPCSSIFFCTNAAGAFGFSEFCNGWWLFGEWSRAQRLSCITYVELNPIALVWSTWRAEWSTCQIVFNLDNQGEGATLYKGFCYCSNVMSFLRILFFVCAKCNFIVTVSHIPGFINSIARLLSC